MKDYGKVYGVYEDRMYGDGKLHRTLISTVTSLPLAKGLAETCHLKTGRNTYIEDANGEFYRGYFVDQTKQSGALCPWLILAYIFMCVKISLSKA